MAAPRANLFRVVYCKLRDIYNFMGSTYASLITKYPLTSILIYIVVVFLLSLGLFQASLITDNERLTLLRNSEAESDRLRIEHTFPFDQSHHYFQHKLTTFGYYFEIIATIRAPHQSIINQTILSQFNEFFDEILTLNITAPIADDIDQTHEFNFTELCAKRVSRCAIEGGVVRAPSFQQALIKGRICYESNDPKFMYLDYEAMDGGSMQFIFSSNRKQECDNSSCCITAARHIRVRFDLLHETKIQAQRSVKFMNTFVEHMKRLERRDPDIYNYFDFNYYTSHTMISEIEKYSLGDVKYVLTAACMVFVVFYLFLTFDSVRLKRIIWCRKPSEKKRSPGPFCVHSSGYLVLIVLFQLVLTAFATTGFMSLCRVPLNTTIYSIIFVLMFTSCNQSLLLYKSLTRPKHIKKNNLADVRRDFLMINRGANSPIDFMIVDELMEPDNQAEIKRRVTRTSQQIVAPIFFALVATSTSYFVIGLVSGLNVIRYYSLFMGIFVFFEFTFIILPGFRNEFIEKAVSLIFNFIGVLMFLCPCLVLHLRRVKANRNCLLPFIKHSSSTLSKSDANGNADVLTNLNNEAGPAADYKLPHFYPGTHRHEPRILKNSIFRFACLFLFLAYNVLNAVVIGQMGRINIPVLDAIPEKSYLRRHLELHYKDFNLGPIVTLNFMHTQNYWEPNTYHRIRSLMDEMKFTRGMWYLELSWLSELKLTMEENEHQQETNCSETLEKQFECFRDSAAFFNLPQYHGDFNLEDRENVESSTMSSFNISSSRMFLQMLKFEGTWDEVVTMNALKDLAYNKYKFSHDELIVHSSVFPMLEQLGELVPATLAQLLIPIECAFMVGLLFVDLKSAVLIVLVHCSFVASVLANMFLVGLSLSIVTLMHLQLIPAIMIEFFAYIGYLYLFNTEKKSNLAKNPKNVPNDDIKIETSEDSTSISGGNTSSSSSSPSGLKPSTGHRIKSLLGMSKAHRDHRLKCVRFVQRTSTSVSGVFSLFMALFGFSFMALCSTFNFYTLFVLLMSVCFNLFLHLYVFCPILWASLGTSWI